MKQGSGYKTLKHITSSEQARLTMILSAIAERMLTQGYDVYIATFPIYDPTSVSPSAQRLLTRLLEGGQVEVGISLELKMPSPDEDIFGKATMH